MTHRGTVPLETDRLRLRRFVETDVTDVFSNWSNDPEVTKFLRWPPHGDIAVTREFMKTRLDNYAREDYYSWAMELKETERVIGTIGPVGQREDTRSVEIGYAMGKAWWGRGYMTEALRRVVKFFFEEVGVNRVEAHHDPRNPGSGKVMRKAGLTYEGTLRQAGTNNQGVCDEARYAILASDYENRKEKPPSMFHPLASISPLPDDAGALEKTWPEFGDLRAIPGLFELARVDAGGHGVVWNEFLDLSSEEIWHGGIPVQ